MVDEGDNVFGERSVGSVARELSIDTVYMTNDGKSVMSTMKEMSLNALGSKPVLQNSQLRHEFASHLMPTRSLSLTGELMVLAPIATISPTPS